jgi:hypothetical protein
MVEEHDNIEGDFSFRVLPAIGTSIHDRKRAGQLALDSELDLLMIRYNAKHTGAEADIFPHLKKDLITSNNRLHKPSRVAVRRGCQPVSCRKIRTTVPRAPAPLLRLRLDGCRSPVPSHRRSDRTSSPAPGAESTGRPAAR